VVPAFARITKTEGEIVKKLIPIIAIMSAASTAHAIKQCAMIASSKYAYNNSDNSFVLAGSCSGTQNASCGGYPQSVAYSGTGAPTNYPCTGIKLAGISACAGSAVPERGKNTGEMCFCKITYPKDGVWVVAAYGAWGNKCASQCANLCGCHMGGDQSGGYAKFRSAMIGGAL
jgi:hypothetical protein